MRDRLVTGLAVAPTQVYEVEGSSTRPISGSSLGLDHRSAHARGRRRAAPLGTRQDAARHLRGDPPRRPDRPPAVRLVPRELRVGRESANEPDVIAIKTTVYRTSDESKLVLGPDRVRRGRASSRSASLELKARFDERRNIEWSRAMEQAGVHVRARVPRPEDPREDDARRAGASPTACGATSTSARQLQRLDRRIYEDVGLFTADEEIAADVADLFNYVTGFGRPQRFRKLLVAPFMMRNAAGRAHPRGRRAPRPTGRRRGSASKLNALVDPTSSRSCTPPRTAGAEIDIQARSICTPRPGVKGPPSTIRVRSIVGRFLEHSRVFWFDAGDATAVYLGSADLMPRNLDRRIEVLIPVEDVRAADRARRDPRQRARRYDEQLGARLRQHLGAPRGEGEEAPHPPGRDDAPRATPRPEGSKLSREAGSAGADPRRSTPAFGGANP